MAGSARRNGSTPNGLSGEIWTDARGYATVALPSWARRLRGGVQLELRPFSRSVTALVVTGLRGGRFTIGTDEPHVKVAWRITDRRSQSADETVTIVVVEGRRMMRRSRELPSDVFAALLTGYQRVIGDVFERMGGREVEARADTVTAAFTTATQAAQAAVAARRAVAAYRSPHGLGTDASIGLHSVEARTGSTGRAAMRGCALCDAAEAGQILLSPATASLLEDQVGESSIRDLGEVVTRRSGRRIRAFELLGAPFD